MRQARRFPIPKLVLAMAAMSSPFVSAQEPDALPSLQDVIADSRRALVLEITVSTGFAQLLDAFVSDVPPGAHVGDPAQLLIRWFDAAGIRIGSRNAWDPRWEFLRDGSEEEVVVLPSATGFFAIPLSADIASVRVTEVESGLALLETDVRAVVAAFCGATPLDPNCEGFGGESDDQDGDGIADNLDNCPELSNAAQIDFDGDGIGDACDPDTDGDLVMNANDVCPATVVPESVPRSGVLTSNHWALLQADGIFTQAGPLSGARYFLTTGDTKGCSCEQIVASDGLSSALTENGCPTGIMLEWINRH